jgi:hypothetical protein
MAASEWHDGPMVQMILARRDPEVVAGDKNPIGSPALKVLAPESVLRDFNGSYTLALFVQSYCKGRGRDSFTSIIE